MKKIFLELGRIILILILLFLPATLIYFYTKDIGVVSIFATLSALSLIFIFIKYFKYIKALGVEAELKETLQEANVKIEQLKEIQEIEAKIFLNQICKRRYIFSNDIESSFKSIEDIYNFAIKINNENRIKDECEHAMIKLIGIELSDNISSLSFADKELKDNLRSYFHLSLDKDLLTEDKIIPTYEALEKIGCIKTNEDKEKLKYFKFAINEYKKLFGSKKLSNTIDIQKIREGNINEI